MIYLYRRTHFSIDSLTNYRLSALEFMGEVPYANVLNLNMRNSKHDP